MLGDALHDTGGSSGAASCASTTLVWLGRLKWGPIAATADDGCWARWSVFWGRTGEQGAHVRPYMLVDLSMRVHICIYPRESMPRYMRAAQQDMAKDRVVIVAIRLMSCEIRCEARALIGRKRGAGPATNIFGSSGLDFTPDCRAADKRLLWATGTRYPAHRVFNNFTPRHAANGALG